MTYIEGIHRMARTRARGIASVAVAGLLVASLVACDSADGSDGGTPPPGDGHIELRYDFNEGDHGWEGGFSDYSPAHGDLGLEFGIAPLPGSLEEEGTGFRIVGMNGSDDLFMFLKRQIGSKEGVEAGQQYRVGYRVVFASDGPTGCFGVGGPPGEGVFVKVGASAQEPEVELDAMDDWQLTIDKGNQAGGGTDMWVIGDIANGIECDEALETDMPHAWVTHEYEHEAAVTAADDGTLWLIVGTDSGFEGLTELFYGSIEVTLEPVEA